MLWRSISPKRRVQRLRRIYSEVEHLATVLPRSIDQIIRQVRSGEFDVHLDHRGIEASVNRLVLGMLASALFVGSSQMLSLKVPPLFHDLSVLGLFGAGASVAIALRLLLAINKSGRLDRRR